jgi:hypothetical protein
VSTEDFELEELVIAVTVGPESPGADRSEPLKRASVKSTDVYIA